ncbi:MAG: DUF4212 domain-containing protein [Gammaproteobacteria bacterium]|nr:DUF4212 domain-containing protein [Gammaproteobacteria bacterium]
MSEPSTNGSGYWRDNMRLVGICLAVWFFVSFGCGILLVDFLNRIAIGGFQLGFWFAQQGSMVVFLVITFVYAARMTVLDRRHGVREDDEDGS